MSDATSTGRAAEDPTISARGNGMIDCGAGSWFTSSKRHLSQPCLILLMGVAGTGKTTLARGILRRLWAVYLDNNHVVDAFFPHTRNGRAYEKLRPCFYQALYAIVEENLKIGNSVLLDAPHVKEMQNHKWRRFIKSLAARTKSKLIVIRCRCSENALRARLESRGEQRDRWKLDHWQEFMTAQPIDLIPAIGHLDIDTDKDLSENVEAALLHITGLQTQGAEQRFRPSRDFEVSSSSRSESSRSINRLRSDKTFCPHK